MKKIFKFKKMSSKIAFVVFMTVLIVGGAACAYMQTRIIAEIDNGARLFIQLQLLNTAEESEIAFAENRDSSFVSDIINRVTIYDTGFSLLSDSDGVFYETNAFTRRLGANEDTLLNQTAAANQESVFDIRLNNSNYTVAHTRLHNGYSLYVLAPRSEVMAEVNASILRFAIIFAVVLPIIYLISFRIGKSMSAPLVALNNLMKKAGNTGDIVIYENEMHHLNELQKNKDEIGQCIASAVELFEHINDISEKLELLSSGDLSIEHEELSDKDSLGKSVNHIINNLNDIFSSMQSSASQVSSASKQIADGALSLAQGSTEQAATVQELSSSISAIAEKTDNNAEMADRAAKLAGAIMQNAKAGSQRMDEMIFAVKEINSASQSISKVIKVIDDIAFQTNILALNAAVEAARAGSHGKGFAVVAEEVRNLAAKSAEAAKDTGGLIANSMEKAELGVRIAGDTAASIEEIVTGINESNNLISEIAKSSEEQSSSISHINSGIDQVAQVVSQNSATAQQSAAASEQMSGQSDNLQQMIAQFRLKTEDTMQLPSGKSLPDGKY